MTKNIKSSADMNLDRSIRRHRRRFKRMWRISIARLQSRGVMERQSNDLQQLKTKNDAGKGSPPHHLAQHTVSNEELSKSEVASNVLAEILAKIAKEVPATSCRNEPEKHEDKSLVKRAQTVGAKQGNKPDVKGDLITPTSDKSARVSGRGDKSRTGYEQKKHRRSPMEGPAQEPSFQSRYELFIFCARVKAKAYAVLHGIEAGWESKFASSVRLAWDSMSNKQKARWKELRRAHQNGKISARSVSFGHDLLASFAVVRDASSLLLRANGSNA
ncbi:hypothetical protein HII31_13759 [Pseudocercospora fuligena]|uniref:Uncharacterized protein n=1 Tax=Pseudocercospora fuligena TaxID=685502 RepID=A0A8H6VAD3_9PEZI|nr:hypothetical protein HII31_13759 [Pseudocercospora fuligena]